MNSEFGGAEQREYRVMLPAQVEQAIKLSGEVLHTDDAMEWSYDDNEINTLERLVIEGTDTLVGRKLTIRDDGNLQVMKYLLDLDNGGFIIIPDLFEPVDRAEPRDEDVELNTGVIEMMYNLGYHLPGDNDWDDFIALLESGKEYLATIRILEAKLGIGLGKAALDINWDEIHISE